MVIVDKKNDDEIWGSFDNYVDDGYDDILDIEFCDLYFFTIVGYIHRELDNRSPVSLLELLFLVNDNHDE